MGEGGLRKETNTGKLLCVRPYDRCLRGAGSHLPTSPHARSHTIYVNIYKSNDQLLNKICSTSYLDKSTFIMTWKAKVRV